MACFLGAAPHYFYYHGSRAKMGGDRFGVAWSGAGVGLGGSSLAGRAIPGAPACFSWCGFPLRCLRDDWAWPHPHFERSNSQAPDQSSVNVVCHQTGTESLPSPARGGWMERGGKRMKCEWRGLYEHVPVWVQSWGDMMQLLCNFCYLQ